jgi:hypothetical protein
MKAEGARENSYILFVISVLGIYPIAWSCFGHSIFAIPFFFVSESPCQQGLVNKACAVFSSKSSRQEGSHLVYCIVLCHRLFTGACARVVLVWAGGSSFLFGSFLFVWLLEAPAPFFIAATENPGLDRISIQVRHVCTIKQHRESGRAHH